MKFTEIGISQGMLQTLQEINYQTPSAIQEQVIPVALTGRDIIGQAQTGTGKTAAFGIPIIEKTEENNDLQHIILAPARELALQILDELKRLGAHKRLRIISVIGGVSYNIQERELRNRPNIIVATPGRFIDNHGKKLINTSKVKTFTLDEADEMLSFGFYKDIMSIHAALPQGVQTLFLTATFNKKIRELAQTITKNAFEVKISEGLTTSEKIDQKYIVVKEREKLEVLVKLLRMINPKAAIIFGRTKRRVDELSDALTKLGFKAIGIQGDMRQRERSNAMQNFRDGKINLLVGTDVMARGIDVDNVDYVFNFDLPNEIEYYTHRIGRTGRANRKGTAVSFVKDLEMSYFKEIMRLTESNPEMWPIPNDHDLEEFEKMELELTIKNLKLGHSQADRELGERIAAVHSKEELGIVIAKLLNSNRKGNATAGIQLTPENAMSAKNKAHGQKSHRKPTQRRDGWNANRF